ncbi:MAG: hypothetical protein FWG65_02755 [Turicibacter sp.]|nr:hypothetical protein [Turicibacter sp.]
MELTRYDGTRFITRDEIDKEFTGKYALISFAGLEERWDGGYLIAVAENSQDGFNALDDIGIFEYETYFQIMYGCAERGVNIHVEILD